MDTSGFTIHPHEKECSPSDSPPFPILTRNSNWILCVCALVETCGILWLSTTRWLWCGSWKHASLSQQQLDLFDQPYFHAICHYDERRRQISALQYHTMPCRCSVQDCASVESFRDKKILNTEGLLFSRLYLEETIRLAQCQSGFLFWTVSSIVAKKININEKCYEFTKFRPIKN